MTPLVCRETATELIRVLSYRKFRLTTAEREALLADYLPFAETATLPWPWPTPPRPCRDRDEAVFIALALSGDCPLVSGDADIRILDADIAPLKILTPAALQRLCDPSLTE